MKTCSEGFDDIECFFKEEFKEKTYLLYIETTVIIRICN